MMLSMHDSEQFLFEALKAGASGYVLKSAADPTLSTPVALHAGRVLSLPVRHNGAGAGLRRTRRPR